MTSAITNVLMDVLDERQAQNTKWGEQNHPDRPAHDDGTYSRLAAEHWKRENDERVARGTLTWDGILLEEVHEALAEATDVMKLRQELVQVAAVAAAWIEAIDRRNE